MNIDKIDTESFKVQSVDVLMLSSVRVLLLSLHFRITATYNPSRTESAIFHFR